MAPRTPFWASAELIREELFSPDRLAEHARSLAAAQPVSSRKVGGRQFSRRLRDNADVLLASYRSIAAAVEAGTSITPAAEWILDNYHIVEEQVFEVRGDLPPGYYRELPKLTDGPFVGLPRVFGLAWAYVAHTDSRFDADMLCGFVDAYQSIQPLSIGELWALPITLRFVLVENLRRAAERIVRSHKIRSEADQYADRILGLSGAEQQPIALVLAETPRPYPQTLVVQLAHRLREPTAAGAAAVQWLEAQARAEGSSVDDAVQAEHARQAGMNVTARNIITSMRAISAANWPDIFERVSLVDALLRSTTNFAEMDFPTRDTYRRSIEKLARQSPLDELAVTRRAIDLAATAKEAGGDARQHDPGFYLLASGRPGLREAIGFRPGWRDRGRTLAGALGVAGYIGVCVALALWVDASVVTALWQSLDWRLLVIFALLALLPAIDLAATILSQIILAIAHPVALPALDLKDGIPRDLRTMVVVPTLLTNPRSIAETIQHLEIHYLSNADDDLTFALVSDWTDASSESMPDDLPLLEVARAEIDRLNRVHPRLEGDRFLLLHRRRVWNETQQCWMGWERKRGKLQELNRLLRGATDTTFLPVGGQGPEVPGSVRFVVTLDSDTRLPRDTVRRLVGKMGHVLNHPRIGPERRMVVQGYGILQPRVTLALPYRGKGSWFRRVFSGARGMDPYAAPVADAYQDLFGEGSFFGKGIYDVDAFEATMEGRAPENAILSHDLFEGIFARAGLAGDVEVVEDFPRRYDVAVSRQHRWARGDWQLVGWLLDWRRAPAGAPPSLSLLGRWKMLDNLRRTLSAPISVLALVAGWFLPPAACLIWTIFILTALVAPNVLPVVMSAFHAPPHSSWRGRLATFLSEMRIALAQSGFVIATLVHQGALMVDALVRTLWRLLVTRRRLLEWTTAEQAAARAEMPWTGFYRWMWPSLVVALAGVLIAFRTAPETGLLALPFVLAWAVAPAVAWWASRDQPDSAITTLTAGDADDLRLTARRTWRFFETFVTADDNWLPPDNFQEAPPQPVIAHRTSPTNIGLYLLSVMAARDFGWISIGTAVERLESTFASLRSMFRFRGHFYNWYDTQDLRPLDPQYVSSVDSGNLAGHLIALANACEVAAEQGDRPAPSVLAGIGDCVALARQAAGETPRPDLKAAIDRLASALSEETGDVRHLQRLQGLAEQVVVSARQSVGGTDDDALVWAEATAATIRDHLHGRAAIAAAYVERLTALARQARAIAEQMDFRFLMDPDRQLLSIGFVTGENRRDSNVYDLLASEARLASYYAIAKGEVDTKHWFKLGRTTTAVDGEATLVSWSGSMFEYLMPSLVMRAPTGSLLETTSRLIVQRQIEYARALGIPWGISESAYNARDIEFTYQYSNFGVPGLGLKRGLSFNTVIAPYATALAAMVQPGAAAANLREIERLGGRGRYGYYEALDFTPSRVPEGAEFAVVRTYMAHHQGMSIVAIANVLKDGVMRSYFHREPIIVASELLLEERHPQAATAMPVRADEVKAPADVRPVASAPPRLFDTPHTARPQSALLSNTRYSVMVTNAGSGFSRWNGLAMTRWREDTTLDDWGSYIYLRDTFDRRVWSAGYQPTCAEPESYSTVFAEDRIRITRRDRTILSDLEIAVSAEDDAEVRRVSLTNIGGMERQIEVTSFAEVVLGAAADDIAHPAFSKMFVETEYFPDAGAIIAHRRKRSPTDADIWAAHFAVVDGPSLGEVEVESDRARFIGVGRDLRAPQALDGEPLSNTVGIVLDPVFSVRRRLLLPPGTTARVSYWTVAGRSRDAVLDQIIKYNDAAAFERVGTLAWTHAQIQLRHIDLSSAEASLFQRLATCILFPEPRFRAADEVLTSRAFEVRGLWAHGISGDLPIVVVRIDTSEDLVLARELVLAHEYLRLKRLSFDLVIINERGSSYAQELQQSLERLARLSETRLLHLTGEGKAGRVFILRDDLISAESRLAIMLAARVVMVGSRGSLAAQLERFASGSAPVARMLRAQRPAAAAARKPQTLEFDNGYGGFGDKGREYVVTLENGNRPPAPWINVVANPTFGFLMSADGAANTWSLNSRDNQITPWSNDPVVNRSGEALYIRDDDSGELWGPTAHPYQNPAGTYRARHGRGYSRFEHTANDISADLVACAALDDPVKILRLRLHNISDRPRRLSVAAYVEWVLATSRSQSAATIVTEMSANGDALLARNARNQAYPGRVAFLALARGEATWTGARTEFLGRQGSTAEPAALVAGRRLSNRVGAGIDPCGALLAPISLQPDETREIVILLGDAASTEDAEGLIAKYRELDPDEVLDAIRQHWDGVLGSITVTTPDRSMDIMLNGWLLYQTLACRMWARSGFYQASGAFGFRDQLQDCLALATAAPALAREHILRAAARQFVEGDVQHWWLPTTGLGVRTRIADDTVWLAYAVAEYVRLTGDAAILDEPLAYIDGPRLGENEHDAFFQPRDSDKTASLYQHCVDAIEKSLAVGAHGLPLMGTGDWNDGMNRVGAGGQGESVWLAWFLHMALIDFAALADARSDADSATRWRAHAAALSTAIEAEAWDGAWYRRAFFDDGTPLGSAQNDACRIDSIAQSWAVMSGAGARERTAQAMAEAERQLIVPDARMALLFTPPFDTTTLEPGYIKGYPPGLRENGGQYTHAAIWFAIARAMQGEGGKAADVFAMLNPINRADSRDAAELYKVEPYVVAADIYSAAGHVGRGGWTWYTGSAGWLYRAGIEWILGLRVEGGRLRIAPAIPDAWPGFRAELRYGAATYVVTVEHQPGTAVAVTHVSLDGAPQVDFPTGIELRDDGAVHQFLIRLGGPPIP